MGRTNSNPPAPWAPRPGAGPLRPLSFIDLVSWDNLLLAYRKASRGKRGRPDVAAFEHRLEENLLELRDDLGSRSYRPGPYASFYIHEPKRRLISAAAFRDRVVHHALCNVIEPVFERAFVAETFANRVGKGTHRALDHAQRCARSFPYVLQVDIRQFFPSIDHALLRALLARKIADSGVLWLIDRILASGVGVLAEEYRMVYFPGDDLFAVNRPRGLPIGNLTSQFWGNVYLGPVDHCIKRDLRCRGYVRYVDDLLLFGQTKGDLWRCQRAIEERLAGLRLTLHPGAHPRPVAEGVPFLGFHLFPERRRLKRRKGVHFQRRLQAQLGAFGRGDLSAERLAACIDGWVNHIRYGNTVGLREAVLGDVPPEVRALLHCESLARSRAGHSPRQTPKRKAGAQLGTMALAASVTGRLAPLLPYLVKGGDKGAVEEVAKTLEDTAQRDVLQGQLRKVLDEDEALARDLQRLLDEVGQPTGGVQVEVRGAVAVGEHATAAGKGSIVIGAGVRGEVHQGQRKKDDDG